MSAPVAAVACAVLLLLVAVALPAYLTAHRLDRLHIRTDLARQALVGVLGRRHVVAVAAARELEAVDPPAGAELAAAVAAARTHPASAVLGADPMPSPRADRRRPAGRGPVPAGADRIPAAADPGAEQCENSLAVVLEGCAPLLTDALRAELDDVTDRLRMARGFYNDSVRDTRTLRERGWVRAFRLAGHAPMPDYVELVIPEPGGDGPAR